MKKSQRLHTILKLKEREEQQLAKQLSEISGLLNDEQSQLSELEAYKGEYQQEMQNMVSRTVSVNTLLNQKRFVSKLDMVVDNQSIRVEQLKGELDAQVRTWGHKKQEINAWEDMIDQARKSEDLAKDKIAQKEMDDLYAARKRLF